MKSFRATSILNLDLSREGGATEEPNQERNQASISHGFLDAQLIDSPRQKDPKRRCSLCKTRQLRRSVQVPRTELKMWSMTIPLASAVTARLIRGWSGSAAKKRTCVIGQPAACSSGPTPKLALQAQVKDLRFRKRLVKTLNNQHLSAAARARFRLCKFVREVLTVIYFSLFFHP